MKTTIIGNTVAGWLLLCLLACSKSKEDVRAGNLPDYSNMTRSSVRLVALNDITDITVNGTPLTNMVTVPVNTPLYPYPTSFFPATGKLSGAWYLPQQFIDANGTAVVKTVSPQVAPMPVLTNDSFAVQDNYYTPVDYYLATSADVVNGAYRVTPVPRTTQAPANPANIKIRLVNLCANGGTYTTDKLSLAYANGDKVNAITSGIGNHQWSDYIELPYGTYQFKVLADGTTRQIPARTPVLMNATSTTDLSVNGTQLYYQPLTSFKPGGAYTLVVRNMNGSYQYGVTPLFVPVFSVITDIEPPVNNTYGKIQAVNAARDNGLTMQVDGVALNTPVYGTAGDYSIIVTGKHTLTVKDAGGNNLSEKSIELKGGDNLTAWAYASGDSTKLLIVSNNMSGIRSRGANTDGSDNSTSSYDPLNFRMLLQTRFLNLCADVPYATFTNANGALFTEADFSSAAAAQNLQPGQTPDAIAVPYPYVDLGYYSGGTVQVYQSRPGTLPGNRLANVAALSPADFVRMPSGFFPAGQYGSEAGVYTVALIGQSAAGKQPALIVVKHNK